MTESSQTLCGHHVAAFTHPEGQRWCWCPVSAWLEYPSSGEEDGGVQPPAAARTESRARARWRAPSLKTNTNSHMNQKICHFLWWKWPNNFKLRFTLLSGLDEPKWTQSWIPHMIKKIFSKNKWLKVLKYITWTNVFKLWDNLVTWQLSVVVVSRQSEAGVAFLSGTNALQHVKPWNDKQPRVRMRKSKK